MPRGAPVSVDDDLASGHAAVGGGAALHEASARVDGEVDGAVEPAAERPRGEHGLDVVPHDRRVHFRRVLRGDEHLGDAGGLAALVGHRDLRLAVGAEPRERARPAVLCEAARQRVREQDRQRHPLRRLRRGVAEDDALVARALLADQVRGRIHAAADLPALPGDVLQDVDAVGVERGLRVVVAQLAHGLAHEGQVVERGDGADLTGQDHDARLAEHLAGDPAPAVQLEIGVEDRVGDVVADLVRVALRHRLGGENDAAAGAARFSGAGARRGLGRDDGAARLHQAAWPWPARPCMPPLRPSSRRDSSQPRVCGYSRST